MKTFKFTCATVLLAVLAGCGSIPGEEPLPASGRTTVPKAASQNEDKPDIILTKEQSRAKKSGRQYLDMMGMSKKELQKQLESEGYKPKDAAKAIVVLKPDWSQEAVEAAANYLDVMSFSRAGLKRQLEFDGFTAKQAAHGVDKAY